MKTLGVNKSGKREVIGMFVSNSEAEIHWRTFLTSLVNRGLCGVKLIVSDDHAGHLFSAEQGRGHHGFAWGNQVLEREKDRKTPRCVHDFTERLLHYQKL